MNVRKFITVFLCLLPLAASASAAGPEVTKYRFEADSKDFLRYNGVFSRAFTNAFPLDMSAGLAFAGRDSGDLLFWAVSGQGPTADAPAFRKSQTDKLQTTKMFPAPNFTPSFGVVRVSGSHAMIGRVTPIMDSSGLPLPGAGVGSKNEMPLADDLKVLATDLKGLNPGGIDVNRKDGSIWVCDGYGPFILKLEKDTGRTIEKYAPGRGLPLEISMRQMGKGFAGVAVEPSGKVLAALGGIMNHDGKLGENRAPFIRIYRLDPKNGDVVAFAYPHDGDAYRQSADASLGDIASVSDDQFLVVEQGEGKDGRPRSLVYAVSVAEASGIGTKRARDGRLIETEYDVAELNKLGLYLAKKTLVCDLGALGWDGRPAGGLAIMGDDTIAVSGGNNFGVSLKMDRAANDGDGRPVTDISAYETGYDKRLYLDGRVTSAKFSLLPNKKQMEFWVIKLPQPLNRYR